MRPSLFVVLSALAALQLVVPTTLASDDQERSPALRERQVDQAGWVARLVPRKPKAGKKTSKTSKTSSKKGNANKAPAKNAGGKGKAPTKQGSSSKTKKGSVPKKGSGAKKGGGKVKVSGPKPGKQGTGTTKSGSGKKPTKAEQAAASKAAAASRAAAAAAASRSAASAAAASAAAASAASASRAAAAAAAAAAASSAAAASAAAAAATQHLTQAQLAQAVYPAGTILADGGEYHQGKALGNLGYQSTGILSSGGCPPYAKITQCWALFLNATGQQEIFGAQNSTLANNQRRSIPLDPSSKDLVPRLNLDGTLSTFQSELMRRDVTPYIGNPFYDYRRAVGYEYGEVDYSDDSNIPMLWQNPFHNPFWTANSVKAVVLAASVCGVPVKPTSSSSSSSAVATPTTGTSSGTGSSGTDTSGTGSSGTGSSVTGSSGTGSSGTDTSGTGSSGTGSSGTGSSGTDTSGTGTSGGTRKRTYWHPLIERQSDPSLSNCGNPFATDATNCNTTSTPTDSSGGNGNGTASTSPPSPRQRIEMLSSSKDAGQTWQFAWKYYYEPSNTETYSFAHIMQLLRRNKCGGYVIALDAKKTSNGDVLIIEDSVRQCGSKCPWVPLANFAGKTVQNNILVRFGEDGYFDYNITDISTTTRKRILRYTASGDMGDNASIKFGLYRAFKSGVTTVGKAYMGDYTANRIS